MRPSLARLGECPQLRVSGHRRRGCGPAMDGGRGVAKGQRCHRGGPERGSHEGTKTRRKKRKEAWCRLRGRLSLLPFFFSSSFRDFVPLPSCEPQPAHRESSPPMQARSRPPPRPLQSCPTSPASRYTPPCAAPAPTPVLHAPVAPPPRPCRVGAAWRAPRVAFPARPRRAAVTRQPHPRRLAVASPPTRVPLPSLPPRNRATASTSSTFAPFRAPHSRPLARPFIPA